MPHFPKPFFKRGRGLWYVEVDRRQHNLGPDREQAFSRYHELMRSRPREPDPSLVLGVLDAFLEWVRQNAAGRTYEWYRRHCREFARAVPPLLSVAELKPFHVTQVLNARDGWSSTTRHGFCRAVQRAFRWAEQQGLIDRSPLAHLKKPKARRREVLITQAEFDRILASYRDEEFRNLLVAAWETGARPQELVRVEARHVDLALCRWVFPIDESKGETSPRVVYLNETVLEISRRLMRRYPNGPLFRNSDGKPWNRFSLNCAFSRLQVRVGLREMKEKGLGVPEVGRFRASAYRDTAERTRARQEHDLRLYERRKELQKIARRHGTKYCLYHFRHSWGTRALQRGVDPLTVAILMGHADPSMLAKVYQHLAHDPDFLRGAAMRVTGPGASTSA
jgi:integrase